MPIQAADLAKSDFIRLLTLGPPGCGKTRLIATCPKPVYVICSDDETKLDSAARVSKDFVYDVANASDGSKLLTQAETCIKEAVRGVNAGEYKTVFWDTFSTFGTLLVIAELDATDDGKGPNGREAYSSFGKRMFNLVSRVTHIKAHVVFTSHDYPISPKMDGQIDKRGEGILPAIEGSIRAKLPGMFRDTCYLAKKKGSQDRELLFHIDGVWGPRSNSLPGVESLPADITEFIRRAESFGVSPSKPAAGGFTKPTAPAKPLVKK